MDNLNNPIMHELMSAYMNLVREHHTHEDLMKLPIKELEGLVDEYTKKVAETKDEEKEHHAAELADIKSILATRKKDMNESKKPSRLHFDDEPHSNESKSDSDEPHELTFDDAVHHSSLEIIQWLWTIGFKFTTRTMEVAIRRNNNQIIDLSQLPTSQSSYNTLKVLPSSLLRSNITDTSLTIPLVDTETFRSGANVINDFSFVTHSRI